MNLEKVESYIKEIEKALTELHKPIQLTTLKILVMAIYITGTLSHL